MARQLLMLCLAIVLLVGCRSAATDMPAASATPGPFTLTSTAFAHQEAIPTLYTCDGEDRSPPLRWSEPPASTKSLTLICEDPDAPVGTWIHWVIYDLPPDLRTLSEGIPPDEHPTVGGTHGKNSWRRLGYGGPCPPRGKHRYFFRLSALDTTLDLKPGASVEQVRKAMEGHILAQAELMGTYTRGK